MGVWLHNWREMGGITASAFDGEEGEVVAGVGGIIGDVPLQHAIKSSAALERRISITPPQKIALQKARPVSTAEIRSRSLAVRSIPPSIRPSVRILRPTPGPQHPTSQQ